MRYGPVRVFDKLNWTVRESEKWIVVGGNGTGKTTLFDLITGENVLGYTQNLHLFGRQKGSGESIWDTGWQPLTSIFAVFSFFFPGSRWVYQIPTNAIKVLASGINMDQQPSRTSRSSWE